MLLEHFIPHINLQMYWPAGLSPLAVSCTHQLCAVNHSSHTEKQRARADGPPWPHSRDNVAMPRESLSPLTVQVSILLPLSQCVESVLRGTTLQLSDLLSLRYLGVSQRGHCLRRFSSWTAG